MNAKELASLLNGREIMKEITADEEKQAADAGLVVVFGYSDDNMEFVGAIYDEVGSYEGGIAYLTKDGILHEPDCGDDGCQYLSAARSAAKAIEAVWHDEGGPCWTFRTDIPHETFNIYEDGELWCVGIVFSMEDLK